MTPADRSDLSTILPKEASIAQIKNSLLYTMTYPPAEAPVAMIGACGYNFFKCNTTVRKSSVL